MKDKLYHCLVAGLPDLELEGNRSLPETGSFRKMLEKELHPDDFRLVKILFYPVDNRNLLKFLFKKESEPWLPGNYSEDEFGAQVDTLDSILPLQDVLPAYMADTIRWFYSLEEKPAETETEIRLSRGYYQEAIHSGNEFLANWIHFETDMEDLLTSMNAGTMPDIPGQDLLGEGELQELLEKSLGQGREFVPPPEPEHAGDIYRKLRDTGYFRREIEADRMKWERVGELSFFHYFSIERILAYLIRLRLAIRWQKLDLEAGRERIEELASDLMKETMSLLREQETNV